MAGRVVSGGQTGADQAGLRAARSVGIPTGGWAPAGWMTEDGPAPRLAGFGLVELAEGGYPERTRANARDSTATVWFGNPDSTGGRTTLRACYRLGKPVYLVIDELTRPSDVAARPPCPAPLIGPPVMNRGPAQLIRPVNPGLDHGPVGRKSFGIVKPPSDLPHRRGRPHRQAFATCR